MNNKETSLRLSVPAFHYLNKSGKRVDVPAYERRNKKPVTSKAFDEWVVKEYLAGRSCPEIAKETGRSVSKVWCIVSAASAIRPHGEAMALRLKNMPSLSEHRGKQLAFHSAKNNCWLPAASRYEYIRMWQLENDKSVISFKRCADRIAYKVNGVDRYYIPDIEVARIDGIVIEEIKPHHFINDPAVMAKKAASNEYYRSTNKQYVIITENEIGKNVIKRFVWSGIAGIPDRVREEKERTRQRLSKNRAYKNMSENEKKKVLSKMSEYYTKRKGAMSDNERDEQRRKNADAVRKSRARKKLIATAAGIDYN